MAGDVFIDKLANLQTFFLRCREESLSLSPQKTQLFMSEVIFTGERVGSDGIRADLSKLTAVVNWTMPATIQNLGSFLGLTGYFKPLIKNYSLLEKPLKDLLNTLNVPKSGGKRAYQSMARSHLLRVPSMTAHPSPSQLMVAKMALLEFLPNVSNGLHRVAPSTHKRTPSHLLPSAHPTQNLNTNHTCWSLPL